MLAVTMPRLVGTGSVKAWGLRAGGAPAPAPKKTTGHRRGGRPGERGGGGLGGGVGGVVKTLQALFEHLRLGLELDGLAVAGRRHAGLVEHLVQKAGQVMAQR